MNQKLKLISFGDLIVTNIYFNFFPEIISLLLTQIIIIFIYQPNSLSANTQGYVLLQHLLSILLCFIFLMVMYICTYVLSNTDYSFAFKGALKVFGARNPRYNLKAMNPFKRLIYSSLHIILLFNILLLKPLLYFFQKYVNNNSFTEYIFSNLYSGSLSSFADPHLYIFMALQLLHVLILLYWVYTKTQKFIALGFKEMVEERYNSEEAKKYPAYSRFWLYAFPIAVLLLWIFIHPLSLLLIQILH